MTSLSQFLHTKHGLAFEGKKDQSIVVAPMSGLVARGGCLFHAQQQSVYVAERDSTGFVQRGSIGLARAGSKIYGSGGALVFAEAGSWVRATDGDTVYCDPGADVVATSGAKVLRVEVGADHPLFPQKCMLLRLPTAGPLADLK